MKVAIILFLSLTFFIGLGGLKRCEGQAFVNGHITAEVIESISASSLTLTSISTQSTVSPAILNQGPNSTASTAVKFGEVTISSGDIVTVSVVQNLISFSYYLRSQQLAELSLKNSETGIEAQGMNPNQDQTKISENLVEKLKPGLNPGSYTVIFACN